MFRVRTVLCLFVAACAFLCVAAVHAQQGWAHGEVDISKGWLVHPGEDPAYAQPGFDDSGWSKFDLHENPDPHELMSTGNARWYRLHLHISAAGPKALMLSGNIGCFEVYVNGRRVGPAIRPSFFWMGGSSAVYLLPDIASGSELVLAVRSHNYYKEFGGTKGDLFAAVLGDPVGIGQAKQADAAARLDAEIFSIAVNAVTAVLGLLLLFLFLQQRAHREYLWLGLTLIFMAMSSGMIAPVYAGIIPSSINAIFGDPSVYFWIAAELEFTFVFTGKRPGRLVRLYQVVLIATPLVLDPLFWYAVLPPSIFDLIENGIVLPGMCLLSVMLVVWWRRGSREAGVLVVPLVLSFLSSFMFNVDDFSKLFNLGWNVLPAFHVAQVSVGLWDICQLVFLLAIGAVLFSRFTRVSREQARSAAELEAARVVQQVLLPEPNIGLEGFHIEAEYLPAQEVGGDFYQIIPTSGGGLMLVTGDVSGKGMPAAMLVALLVGAIRTEAAHTSDPATLLATLNQRVYGRMSSGFATCAALHLLPDGTAVLANAANPSPYLNGREVALPGALPLGMLAEVEYQNHSLTLSDGDILTFVSDGIIEAQNPDSRELFGFERTRAISMDSAAQQAKAAHKFGQNDDITVLRISKLTEA
jgi:sigma-B regulation protein RsbU (phosphoserine phosphatase)